MLAALGIPNTPDPGHPDALATSAGLSPCLFSINHSAAVPWQTTRRSHLGNIWHQKTHRHATLAEGTDLHLHLGSCLHAEPGF